MIDFWLFGGFVSRLTDRLTDGLPDIGGCRVAFATENATENKMHLLQSKAQAKIRRNHKTGSAL